MKAKLLREWSAYHPQVILSPKTKLFDLTSAASLASTCTRPHLSHRSLKKPPSKRPSRPQSHGPGLGTDCFVRTQTRLRAGSFGCEGKDSCVSEGRKVRRASENGGRSRACIDLNDLIIAHVSTLHATERHNTLRLSSDLKSVLGEINKSVRDATGGLGVTIALEDKVKAWKEYNEENKKVVVLTKARCRGEERERMVRRKFLMASLSRKTATD